MVEVLPIKVLRDSDAPIFGNLNVALGKLSRLGLPVVDGVVVTPPSLKLKTTLEYFDFGHKEIFEQSLSLVKKELQNLPIPEILSKEIDGKVPSKNRVWLELLISWIEQIKGRLWREGFFPGITEGLEPQVVIFTKKPKAFGQAFYEPSLDETIIDIKNGKLGPKESKELDELVQLANKKLFIPHKYEWVVDNGLKLTKVLPYTPGVILEGAERPIGSYSEDSQTKSQASLIASPAATLQNDKNSSVVKVFLNLSSGFAIEDNTDGVYLVGEKIFDLNRPESSFEELIFKLVEAGNTGKTVFLKLADMSEGMGKVRGTLRLIHQKSLLDPLCEALLFARNKKDLLNIHVVIPFVRGVNELQQIKRDLAVKKLMRKNSLQQWLEIAVPENIINLEEYLLTGLDGVVLNLDELSAYLSGYDHNQQDVSFYKHEVSGLLKFLEDGVKLLHKSRVRFIAYGSLTLNPTVLEFLIEKGVYGVVAERYEAPSMVDLLKQAEKRFILRRGNS